MEKNCNERYSHSITNSYEYKERIYERGSDHHLATRTVYHPKEKPWITAENATTEELIAQIKKCPSGALSYRMNNEKEDK